MFTLLSRYWWVLVARGILAVMLGICALMWPFGTLLALALVFGAIALADGTFLVGTALAGHKRARDWAVLLLQGLFGIAVGLLAIFLPVATSFAFMVVMAGWAIVMGVLQIVAAIRLRRELPGEWWLGLGGVLGIVFGILFLSHPGAGALALLSVIGVFGLVWGTILIVGGFDVRRLSRRSAF